MASPVSLEKVSLYNDLRAEQALIKVENTRLKKVVKENAVRLKEVRREADKLAVEMGFKRAAKVKPVAVEVPAAPETPAVPETAPVVDAPVAAAA